jgi:hypothetical protein
MMANAMHFIDGRRFNSTKEETLGFTVSVMETVMNSIRAMACTDGTIQRLRFVDYIKLYDSYFSETTWSSLIFSCVYISNESDWVEEEDIRKLLLNYVIDAGEVLSSFKYELHEEMYEDGVQYISIFDTDGSRFEIRVWNDVLHYSAYKIASDAEVIDEELYKIINKYSTLEKTSKSWKELRQR